MGLFSGERGKGGPPGAEVTVHGLVDAGDDLLSGRVGLEPGEGAADATTEVSVSLTIDQTQALKEIEAELSKIAEWALSPRRLPRSQGLIAARKSEGI